MAKIDLRDKVCVVTGANSGIGKSTAQGLAAMGATLVMVCRDRAKAFKSYVGRSGKCYVAPEWCPMARAVEVIVTAGGIPVLAHPHRYATSTSGLRRLLRDFSESGGEGLEVACSNLDNPMIEKLAGLALETGLYASVGSDFHTAAATWMDIGKLPELPAEAKKNAIWVHPRWHF